ncbi:hypothetical protein D3C81_442110 [compost metagenome]
MHTMKSVMEALLAMPGAPVLTSNQCHLVASALNAHPVGGSEPAVPYRFIVRSTGGGPTSCKVDEAAESLWKSEGHARRYHAKDKELTGDQVAGRSVFWPGEFQIVPLYTHAGAGEFERLRAENEQLRKTLPNSTTELVDLRGELEVVKKLYAESCQASYDFGSMQAQLAERDSLLRNFIEESEQDFVSLATVDRAKAALSASTELSAPAERDERVEFEAACHTRAKSNGRTFEPHYFKRASADGRYLNPMAESGWQGWQARAALEKPNEN